MRRSVPTVVKAAIAVCGLVVGAIVLRLVDQDAGWAESLSAVATAGATAAALWIATRARSDRKEERLNADRAQARLVLLDIEGPYSNSDAAFHFVVIVQDNGMQPILDVALESAQYGSGSGAVSLLVPSDIVIPIVMPDLAPGTITVAFPSRETAPAEVREIELDSEGNWPVSDRDISAKVVATVQFTDAGGNRWRRSNAGLVELVTRA